MNNRMKELLMTLGMFIMMMVGTAYLVRTVEAEARRAEQAAIMRPNTPEHKRMKLTLEEELYREAHRRAVKEYGESRQ